MERRALCALIWAVIDGSVLCVRKGLAIHMGIKFPHDRVLHGSPTKGVVVLDTFEDFSGGKQVWCGSYPGTLEPIEVLRRASEMLGTRFSLVSNNCEHVVTQAQET